MAQVKLNPAGSASGWSLANKSVKRRMLLSIEGMEKSGKNNLAFSAPGDIRFHSADFGDDGVIQKFQAKKKIWKAEYKLHIPANTAVDDAAAIARPVWAQFLTNFKEGLTAPNSRTTILDTGTEFHEILRMAEFGKLQQVMPHHYGPVNQAMKDIWRSAADTSCNLIVLHRMKEEWINKVVNGKEKGERTGNYIMAGYSGTYYEAQVCVRTYKEDGHFKCLIFDCRLNPDLEGMVLEDEMITFPALGQLVFPDSSEEDWI